jgi:hypothetical protein
MAQHQSQKSMQKEALKEMIEVAEYCIKFDKAKSSNWIGFAGCYGYPGASILLSIVDTLGSIVEGGGDDVSKHFKILNNPDWYNLNFSSEELILIERSYRNKLSHNSYIHQEVQMAIGGLNNNVLEKINNKTTLFLLPFLERSIFVVNKFLISQ